MSKNECPVMFAMEEMTYQGVDLNHRLRSKVHTKSNVYHKL